MEFPLAIEFIGNMFYANFMRIYWTQFLFFCKFRGIKCKFLVYFPIGSGFNLKLLVIYRVLEECGIQKLRLANFQ